MSAVRVREPLDVIDQREPGGAPYGEAVTRQQFMTYCAMRKDAIVVSGSHGKSTTTSMLATAFIAAQQDPTIVLGSLLRHDMGVSKSMGATSCARHGKSRWFIYTKNKGGLALVNESDATNIKVDITP